ncbi:hypothetical protein MASR1M74_05900 [Lentimicrobium sp.]
MKRSIAALLLCILHLAFIILPEAQLWPYLNAIAASYSHNEVTALASDSKAPLTGDVTYLKALVERSRKMEDTKEQQRIPETNVSHTGLIYLPSDEINHRLYCIEKPRCFAEDRSPLTGGIIKLLSPPPKFTFC